MRDEYRAIIMFMIFGLLIVALGMIVFAPGADATTGGECTTYRNHSGHLPDQYDYGIFIEYRPAVRITSTHSENPRDYGAGSRWDKVKKCKDKETTTTTSVVTSTTVPDTSTTTLVETTTTSVVTTTSTNPTTTTSIVETTTSMPESTTSTEGTTTTSEQETTTTSEQETTTSVPESSTTSSTQPPVTPPEEPPTLPETGVPVLLFVGLGLGVSGTGAFLVRAARRR